MISFQKLDLFLEFVGVGPVVVAFAEGYVGGTGGRDGGVHYLAQGAICLSPLVFSLVDGMDDVGVLGGILADDVGGMVGGSIIVDDSHEREVGLLHDKTFETFTKIGLVVEDEAFDDDFIFLERLGS